MSDFKTTENMNVKKEDTGFDEKKEEVVGLDDETEKIFTLKDKHEKAYIIPLEFVRISTLLSTMIDGDNSDMIKIDTIDPKILELVIEYMRHHKGVEPPLIEKPLKSKVMKDVCKDSWDADFIDKIGKNLQNLYDVIMAANYFDIPSLLHLGSAKVASLIKGAKLEEIKKILSL